MAVFLKKLPYICQIPAGKHMMDLVAVDWFKDTKRMDHVARRQGCAVQVSVINFSVCYFVVCI